MKLQWTARARGDLVRLHAFLAKSDPRAAARAVRGLVSAPVRLARLPRLGERLEEFSPREVRRWLVGSYEVRYEVRGRILYVLRLWHVREDR